MECSRIKLWLSRQACGKYMLTVNKPIIETVLGTKYKDFYIVPGEPFGIRNICQLGAKAMFGVKLDKLTSIEVTLRGNTLN